MADLIDRQQAIDEVKRLHDVAWANWKETRISANTMIDALKDLPSAQPETHDKRTETHACDLINRLSELRCQYNCFDENERDAYHTLSEAIKAISAQPRWISCSEMMPDRDGKYLVTSARYKLVSVKEFSLKYWWEDGTPLAWMPLPEPYGGKSDV